MSADLPHALAAILSSAEQNDLGYVLYRDPESDPQVVLVVEGSSDATALEAVLRRAGAEERSSAEGRDFVLSPPLTDAGAERKYVIKLAPGSGKTGIAALLWLAATDAGAAAARKSVEGDT